VRSMEIPMIQFLEQIYNEASIRAKNSSSATPLEFQVILREFARQPSEERQKVFLEHLQHGKHSLDHLGTITILALRELTQSLTSRDFELVTLAQSQSDAPRFQVQTGVTCQNLFILAIVEAARLMDRNPTYFSRSVGSTKMLENRAIIRKEIETALRTAIEDNAIKGYLSLRQHIADVSMQGTNANNALQDHRQKQKRSEFRSTSRQMMPNSTQTWKSAVDFNDLADTPDLPSPKKPEKMPSNLAVPILAPSKQQMVDLDQRASPLSSNDAKQAQEEFQNSLLKSKTKTEQRSTVPIAPTAQVAPPVTTAMSLEKQMQPEKKVNLQEGRFRLEEPTAARSEQQIAKPLDTTSKQMPRANSDNAIRKEVANDIVLASEEFLSGDEEDDEEEL